MVLFYIEIWTTKKRLICEVFSCKSNTIKSNDFSKNNEMIVHTYQKMSQL